MGRSGRPGSRTHGQTWAWAVMDFDSISGRKFSRTVLEFDVIVSDCVECKWGAGKLYWISETAGGVLMSFAGRCGL